MAKAMPSRFEPVTLTVTQRDIDGTTHTRRTIPCAFVRAINRQFTDVLWAVAQEWEVGIQLRTEHGCRLYESTLEILAFLDSDRAGETVYPRTFTLTPQSDYKRAGGL